MPRTATPVAAIVALLLAFAPATLGAIGVLPAVAAAAEDGPVTWSVEASPTSEGGRVEFSYNTDPGTQIQDTFLITNGGTTSADFVIYATDAVNDPDTGVFGLLPGDVPPSDLGAWITPADDTITIGPGLQATVPFNLLIPSDASPGDHTAGIVAAVFTEAERDGSTVLLEQRVGVRVLLTVSGDPIASVESQGLTSAFSPSINPFAPGELNISYEVRNTGNKRVDVNQAIRVEGPFGVPLGSTTPAPIQNLLPRQAVRVNVQLTGIGALLFALSTVSLQPGSVGSAGTTLDSRGEPAPTPDATATAGATPLPTDTDAAAAAPVDADQTTIDYTLVSSQTGTIAITWTLLLLVLLVIAAVYLIARYVSGTRERLYAAIDEAAEAAREEALAGKNEVAPR